MTLIHRIRSLKFQLIHLPDARNYDIMNNSFSFKILKNVFILFECRAFVYGLESDSFASERKQLGRSPEMLGFAP